MPATNSPADTRSESFRIPTALGQVQIQWWEASRQHDPALAPIVLLHDSLGCIALWRDFPEKLAALSKRRVIAYDRPGFGLSDPYPGTLPVPAFIADETDTSFAAVCEAMRIHQFIVIGHSVGGSMAICCAAKRSASCNGLVTLAAQAIMEDYTRAGVEEARQIFAHPGHIEPLRQYHGDKANWVLDAWLDAWSSAAMSDWNLTQELQAVQCPTLIVQGERDDFCSMHQAEHITAHTGGPVSRLNIPKCGHSPHREKQPILLESLGEWLDMLA